MTRFPGAALAVRSSAILVRLVRNPAKIRTQSRTAASFIDFESRDSTSHAAPVSPATLVGFGSVSPATLVGFGSDSTSHAALRLSSNPGGVRLSAAALRLSSNPGGVRPQQPWWGSASPFLSGLSEIRPKSGHSPALPRLPSTSNHAALRTTRPYVSPATLVGSAAAPGQVVRKLAKRR